MGFREAELTKHGVNENEVLNRRGMVKRWAETGRAQQRTANTE
jgi:hypothetical protein